MIYFKLIHIQDEMVDGMEVGAIISSVNAAIIAVDLAGIVLSGILPIQPVFRVIKLFLTNLRVRSLLFVGGLLQAHTRLGRDGRRCGMCTQARVGVYR